MCRNIKTLFNFEPPATEDEIQASALQFVRKLSGFNKPSQVNAAAFERAVSTRCRRPRASCWRRCRRPRRRATASRRPRRRGRGRGNGLPDGPQPTSRFPLHGREGLQGGDHQAGGFAREGAIDSRREGTVSLRIDRDVLDFFQEAGPGWQDRINAALRKAAGKN